MKAYTEYRKPDTLWIEQIPSHWHEVRLKRVTTKLSREATETAEVLICSNKGEVFHRGDKRIGLIAANEDSYQGVAAGDLLIHGMDTWHGAIAISNYYGKCTTVVHVCDSTQNKQYYAYFLRMYAFRKLYKAITNGVRQNTSDLRSWSKAGNISVALPPRAEQDQIVRFLDWKLSETNSFIRQKRREIVRLTEIANTQIRNTVFGGLQSDVATKDSGISWAGEIPNHWDVRVLFELAAEQSISNKTFHNQNLLSLSYGKIVNKDINTMDGLLPASYDTYQIVSDGNVIMRLTDLQNDKRSLRVGIATQTGIITSAYTCLKVRSDEILPHYLYLLLHSYDICKVFYSMGGGVRQSIGYGEIKRMALPLPPVEEQQAIVDYCYSLRTDIERLIAEVKREIELIAEYRTRMISDVVTGKVDVRGIEVPDLSAEDTIVEEADDAEMDDAGSTDEIEEVEENADD